MRSKKISVQFKNNQLNDIFARIVKAQFFTDAALEQFRETLLDLEAGKKVCADRMCSIRERLTLLSNEPVILSKQQYQDLCDIIKNYTGILM